MHWAKVLASCRAALCNFRTNVAGATTQAPPSLAPDTEISKRLKVSAIGETMVWSRTERIGGLAALAYSMFDNRRGMTYCNTIHIEGGGDVHSKSRDNA
jgi:hypothetical protein